jgi:hypothetical protein
LARHHRSPDKFQIIVTLAIFREAEKQVVLEPQELRALAPGAAGRREHGVAALIARVSCAILSEAMGTLISGIL